MCGIVGYLGQKNAQNFLISGLKRLEYRGYDSAGIVTLNSSSATLLKSLGKIKNLEAKISTQKTDDTTGIGHTRWATHGAPSERNAHPHESKNLFLVHNGIIENYQSLKDATPDHVYQSETDSEVLVALIDTFYADGKYPLSDAVVQALKLVRGTYGIAVVAKNRPDEIVVARMGSPLIIGLGEGETFVASDASALIGYTKQAIYLNDGEIADITPAGVEIRTLAAEPVSAKVETIQTDLSAVQKGGYDHFLLKEIMEQPNSLTETLRGRIDPETKSVHLGGPHLSREELKSINHLVIVGCGTAYHAGLLAAYYIEQFTPDITIETVFASEYRYRNVHLSAGSVALIVSQSGETADTLACLRMLKSQGIKTIGIVNAIGSTIAREVDGGTYVHVGPEISVASTKAFTSQAIAMLMFGLTIAEAKGVSPALLRPYSEEILALPDAIRELLKTAPAEISALASAYKDYDHAMYLGRDTAYPVAMEGALKLKEVSYIDANAYAFGELKHGSIALIDDRFFEVAFLPVGPLYEKSVSGVQEILARGAHAIVFTNSPDFALPVEHVVKLTTPKINLLTPFLMNVLSQLLAYYITVARGHDVDQPRNLAKSVTVE